MFFKAAGYRETHAKELSKLDPVPREERMIRIFILPSVERQIEEIGALEPPTGDEQRIETILDEMNAGLKQSEEKPYRASFEVPSEYSFNRLSELARAYGFEECSNPT